MHKMKVIVEWNPLAIYRDPTLPLHDALLRGIVDSLDDLSDSQ
jgi:hypothetical protein